MADCFEIKNNVLQSYSGDEEIVVVPKEVSSIGEYAFKDCHDITEIILHDNITSIGKYAFYNCFSLIKINIPTSLQIIKEGTFLNCINLKNVVVPDNVQKIGDSAFENCRGMERCVISKNIEIIGYGAFKKCRILRELIFRNRNIKIHKEWFIDNPNDDDVELMRCSVCGVFPSQVPKVKKKLLLWAVKILLDDKVLDVDWKKAWLGYLKSKRKSLYKVILENHDLLMVMTKEKLLTLKDVKNLIELSSDNSLMEVSVKLLNYQNENFTENELSEFTINELINVKIEDVNSVSYLKKLWNFKLCDDGNIIITNYKGFDSNIVVPSYIGDNKVTAIGERAFSPISNNITEKQKNHRTVIKSIHIPEGISSIGDKAFWFCKGLEELKLPDGIKSINGCEGDYGRIYSFIYGCDKLEHLIIPESVKTIEEHAFYGSKSLRSLVLPEYIEYMGNRAFWYCENLESLKLPNGIKAINGYENPDFWLSPQNFGGFAYGCYKLKTFIIPESLTYIGAHTFMGCDMLENIVVSEGNPKYSAVNGILYDKKREKILFVPKMNEERSVLCQMF